MFTLTDSQEKEIQAWLKKLPDSMVKSHITNLFEEVWPTNRMTSEQLEKFMSFQNALPKEFQSYPQVVAQWLKNEPETKREEAALGIDKKSQVDFGKRAAETHANIKAEKSAGAKGDQKQEILHTLNVTDKTKAGTKAVSKLASEQPSYEEELRSDAAKSAKTSGGKPPAQKAEEESIIARNRDVSDGGKATAAQKERAEKSIRRNQVVVVNRAVSKKGVTKASKSATKKKR